MCPFEHESYFLTLEIVDWQNNPYTRATCKLFPELSTVSQGPHQWTECCSDVTEMALLTCKLSRRYDLIHCTFRTDPSPWQLSKLQPLMKTGWYSWELWKKLVSRPWVGIVLSKEDTVAFALEKHRYLYSGGVTKYIRNHVNHMPRPSQSPSLNPLTTYGWFRTDVLDSAHHHHQFVTQL